MKKYGAKFISPNKFKFNKKQELKMKSLFTYFFFFLMVILVLNNIIYAQWSNDPNINNAICTSIGDQTDPTIISDGSGGAIITWPDYRNGSNNSDIYVQHIDANGVIQWTADGIAVCAAADYQLLPAIVSDGSGGAIIAWVDNRYGNNYDIYAQHVDADGVIQWLADGVAVCEATYYQANPAVVSDGNGGAFIIWQDQRSGNYDIYAQRIDANGLAQWTADGVVICSNTGSQTNPKLVSDGNDGVIITWNDIRGSSYDIYAQLIDLNGEVQWITNGVAICTAQWEQSFPKLTGDGSGGAIITWEDHRTPPVDIYAQRINAAGGVQWAGDGVPISALSYDQVSPDILSDGSGGAIISWQVNSSGNDYDIYAQRIDANGTLQWTMNGIPICTADHHQQDPKIINDEIGGAIVTWEDQRSSTNYDIYAQRFDASGLVQWTADGVAISTATYDQIFPTLVGDGRSGAIITWQDYRVAYPDSVDIYAQQVNTNGNIGVVTGIAEVPLVISDFTLQQNYPNPFNPSTSIQYAISSRQFVSLKVYDVLGNELATLVNEFRPAGKYETQFNSAGLPSGVYFYQLKAGEYIQTKKMILLK